MIYNKFLNVSPYQYQKEGANFLFKHHYAILADEMGQRLFRKGMQIMGPYSQLGENTKWAPMRAQMQTWYYSSFGHTIAGGTSEIIRNTIATVGLGLPRS